MICRVNVAICETIGSMMNQYGGKNKKILKKSKYSGAEFFDGREKFRNSRKIFSPANCRNHDLVDQYHCIENLLQSMSYNLKYWSEVLD